MEIRNRIQNAIPHFTARNKTIRFADDLARHVNKCYPRISATLVDSMKFSNQFEYLMAKLNAKIDYMRSLKYTDIYLANHDCKKMEAVVNAIRNTQIGNCGESAQLAYFFAKVNGLKSVYLSHLVNRTGNSLDHAVVYVDDKKPYIIDVWLGFADYVPNAINRYKSEFSHCFDKRKLRGKLNFPLDKQSSMDKLITNLAADPCEVQKLKKRHKNWVLKKRK